MPSGSRFHLGEQDYEARWPPRDLWRLEWQRLARYDLIRANAWRRAVSDDMTGFATLEDPFEPMMQLWQLGYAHTALTSDAIILTAPAAVLPVR